jgi:hypothetical protein
MARIEDSRRDLFAANNRFGMVILLVILILVVPVVVALHFCINDIIALFVAYVGALCIVGSFWFIDNRQERIVRGEYDVKE